MVESRHATRKERALRTRLGKLRAQKTGREKRVGLWECVACGMESLTSLSPSRARRNVEAQHVKRRCLGEVEWRGWIQEDEAEAARLRIREAAEARRQEALERARAERRLRNPATSTQPKQEAATHG